MISKVTEVFQSIQGEGKYAGVKQVFVRFFDCNLRCVWCDTPTSQKERAEAVAEMSVEGVFQKILKLYDNCHSVSLTGGEPLTQTAFLLELLPLMKKSGMKIFLETNGILYGELSQIIEHLDVISMDIKLPSSTGLQGFWQEHEAFLKVALQKDVFIKTVISMETQQEDIEKMVALIASADLNLFLYLQPNTEDLSKGVLVNCLDFHDYCLQYLPNVRILPQVHKFIDIP